jgi:hypothetical protein
MLTKVQLSRLVRAHAEREIYDDSGMEAVGTAIYALADPRDLRLSRYIGQTSSPRRRLLQHLSTARLWMPDERPWWVSEPKLRPLYDWIRELHHDGGRLPTMVIYEWTATAEAARLAERARIYDSLSRRLPLLNVEQEILGGQWPLL